jgi:hypothetical protein
MINAYVCVKGWVHECVRLQKGATFHTSISTFFTVGFNEFLMFDLEKLGETKEERQKDTLDFLLTH